MKMRHSVIVEIIVPLLTCNTQGCIHIIHIQLYICAQKLRDLLVELAM